MPNEQNLMPIGQLNSRRTREQHSKDSQKGGQKSGEVRRQKKAMKDTMKMLLSLEMPESEGKEKLRELGIDDEELNVQTAILMQQINKALKGNLDSAKFVRDVSDEIGAIKDDTSKQDRVVIVDDLEDLEDDESN